MRECGARIRFITDGDVSAALLAVTEGTGVDLLWGIGGTPEGVLSAAAIKSMGGHLVGRLWPRDDDERTRAKDAGYDLDEVLDVNRLVSGEDVFFAATGVTDGDLLQGVRYRDGAAATTESLVMRSRSGTVRKVQATHNRAEAARADRHAVRLALRGSRSPRARPRRTSPRSTSRYASASAPSMLVSTCEPWSFVGRTCQPSSRARRACSARRARGPGRFA